MKISDVATSLRFLLMLLRSRSLLTVYRLLLGAIFVYASIHKIQKPDEFARIVYNYRLLPATLVNLVAITLPWIELTAGGLLILGAFARENAAVIAAMLLVFIVGLGAALWRGLEIDCGCFSSGDGPSNLWAGIAEDFVMLLMAGLILAYGAGYGAVESLWRRSSREAANPKSEYRNSKQTAMRQTRNGKRQTTAAGGGRSR